MRYSLIGKCLIVSASLLLVSCEVVEKAYKVITNPDIRVGDRLDQPSTYSLSIFATSWVNGNVYSDNTDIIDLDIAPGVAPSDAFDPESGGELNLGVDSALTSNFSPDLIPLDDELMNQLSMPKPAQKQLLSKPSSRRLPLDLDVGTEIQIFSDLTEAAKDKRFTDGEAAPDEKSYLIREELEGADQKATPVRVRIFQLGEKSLFLGATYDELNEDNFETTLGKTYISHDELMLDPNQFRFFDSKPVEEATTHIGVIAYFNGEETRQWRDIVKIKPMGESYPLLVRLTRLSIKLHKDN